MATTTGDDLYRVDISDGNDTVQHAIKDAVARADVGELKSAVNSYQVPLVSGKYVATSSGTAILPTNMTSNNSYSCCCVECHPGELFLVSGAGGSTPRLWAFSTSDGTLISQEVADANKTNLLVTAPENAAYFAFNTKPGDYSGTSSVVRGGTPDARLKILESDADIFNMHYIKCETYSKPSMNRGYNINASGVKVDSTKFVSSDMFAPINNIAVDIDNDLYLFRVARYTNNGSITDGTGFVERTDTLDDTFIVPNDWAKIVITVFRKDNAVIVAGTETTTIRNALTFYTLTDPSLAKAGVPADAKTVGDRLETDETNLKYILNANKTPYVIARNHRGYSSYAPENTLVAFKMSRQRGFTCVETDVQFTSDGVAVLLHDASINRTARNADGTELSETVNIADITYDEALEYDFGIWKGAEYAGTTIPTLEDFVKLCRAIGLEAHIELKSMTQANVNTCIGIVEDCGMLDHVSWISSSAELLGYVKSALPNAKLRLVKLDTITSFTIETAQGLKTDTNEVAIDSSSYTSAEIALCKAAKIPLGIGTLNTTSDILAAPKYATLISSNSLHAGNVLFNANIT